MGPGPEERLQLGPEQIREGPGGEGSDRTGEESGPTGTVSPERPGKRWVELLVDRNRRREDYGENIAGIERRGTTNQGGT